MIEFEAPEAGYNDRIIELIYKAVEDPTAWRELLLSLSEKIHATGAFVAHTHPGSTIGHIATGFIEKTYPTYVLQGHYLKDMRTPRLLKFDAPRFITEEDVLSPREFDSSAFFTDYIAGTPGGRHTAAVFSPKPGLIGGLHFERGKSTPAFSQASRDWLDGFQQHLNRAFAMTFGAELSRKRSIVSSLRTMGLPAAFIDFSSQIEVSNDLFDDTIEEVIRINGKMLPFDGSEGACKLHRVIKAFELSWLGEASPQSAMAVPLHSTRGGLPFLVHVMRNCHGPESLSVSLLLTIARVGAGATLSTGHIECLFGLTNAEAAVAGAVGAGKTVGEIAAMRGLSEHTVRGYVKVILDKLDINRQVDLVKTMQIPVILP